MKVGVLGGGTAGFMAAATVSKRLPEVELYHVYDPLLPTIGVGEGTVPIFREWIHSVTGVTEGELAERTGATRKYGIQFEGWGRSELFHHLFMLDPYAYHVHAGGIVELLAEHCHGQRIHRRVREVTSDGRGVALSFEGGDGLELDFLFDARGFPPPNTAGAVPLPGMTTNAAFVRGAPPVSGLRYTRAVARPHGWVFVIPLTFRTSYGHIYNRDLTSPEEIEAELEAVMREDATEPIEEGRHLAFPSFVRRRVFDGAHLTIGNAASFVEPLEATALAVAQFQISAGCRVIRRGLPDAPAEREAGIRAINDDNYRMLLGTSLFIGWHYAYGSRWDTPFWRGASDGFQAARATSPSATVRAEFEAAVAGAARYDHVDEFMRLLDAPGTGGEPPVRIEPNRYVGFGLPSFIQMATGLAGAGAVAA